MPSYLVEGYFPRSRAVELTGLIVGLRTAADELTAAGTRVRHVRSSFLPDDELFLHLVEAESAEAPHNYSGNVTLGFGPEVDLTESSCADSNHNGTVHADFPVGAIHVLDTGPAELQSPDGIHSTAPTRTAKAASRQRRRGS